MTSRGGQRAEDPTGRASARTLSVSGSVTMQRGPGQAVASTDRVRLIVLRAGWGPTRSWLGSIVPRSPVAANVRRSDDVCCPCATVRLYCGGSVYQCIQLAPPVYRAELHRSEGSVSSQRRANHDEDRFAHSRP